MAFWSKIFSAPVFSKGSRVGRATIATAGTVVLEAIGAPTAIVVGPPAPDLPATEDRTIQQVWCANFTDRPRRQVVNTTLSLPQGLLYQGTTSHSLYVRGALGDPTQDPSLPPTDPAFAGPHGLVPLDWVGYGDPHPDGSYRKVRVWFPVDLPAGLPQGDPERFDAEDPSGYVYLAMRDLTVYYASTTGKAPIPIHEPDPGFSPEDISLTFTTTSGLSSRSRRDNFTCEINLANGVREDYVTGALTVVPRIEIDAKPENRRWVRTWKVIGRRYPEFQSSDGRRSNPWWHQIIYQEPHRHYVGKDLRFLYQWGSGIATSDDPVHPTLPKRYEDFTDYGTIVTTERPKLSIRGARLFLELQDDRIPVSSPNITSYDVTLMAEGTEWHDSCSEALNGVLWLENTPGNRSWHNDSREALNYREVGGKVEQPIVDCASQNWSTPWNFSRNPERPGNWLAAGTLPTWRDIGMPSHAHAMRKALKRAYADRVEYRSKSWWDRTIHGSALRPSQAGAQYDFGATKLTEWASTGCPDFRAIRRSVYFQGRHYYDWRGPDLTPIDLSAPEYRNDILGDYLYTHAHCTQGWPRIFQPSPGSGASAAHCLGQPRNNSIGPRRYDPTSDGAGIRPYKDSHWEQNCVVAAVELGAVDMWAWGDQWLQKMDNALTMTQQPFMDPVTHYADYHRWFFLSDTQGENPRGFGRPDKTRAQVFSLLANPRMLDFLWRRMDLCRRIWETSDKWSNADPNPANHTRLRAVGHDPGFPYLVEGRRPCLAIDNNYSTDDPRTGRGGETFPNGWSPFQNGLGMMGAEVMIGILEDTKGYFLPDVSLFSGNRTSADDYIDMLYRAFRIYGYAWSLWGLVNNQETGGQWNGLYVLESFFSDPGDWGQQTFLLPAETGFTPDGADPTTKDRPPGSGQRNINPLTDRPYNSSTPNPNPISVVWSGSIFMRARGLNSSDIPFTQNRANVLWGSRRWDPASQFYTNTSPVRDAAQPLDDFPAAQDSVFDWFGAVPHSIHFPVATYAEVPATTDLIIEPLGEVTASGGPGLPTTIATVTGPGALELAPQPGLQAVGGSTPMPIQAMVGVIPAVLEVLPLGFTVQGLPTGSSTISVTSSLILEPIGMVQAFSPIADAAIPARVFFDLYGVLEIDDLGAALTRSVVSVEQATLELQQIGPFTAQQAGTTFFVEPGVLEIAPDQVRAAGSRPEAVFQTSVLEGLSYDPRAQVWLGLRPGQDLTNLTPEERAWVERWIDSYS